MIINQIANHVREIMLALRTEYIDVPGLSLRYLGFLRPLQDGWCHGIGCFDSGAHTSRTGALLPRTRRITGIRKER